MSGNIKRLTACASILLPLLSEPATAEAYLNCKSWLTLKSADRVAVMRNSADVAISALMRALELVTDGTRAEVLAAFKECLTEAEPYALKSLDELCAENPSAGSREFRSVLDGRLGQCKQEISRLL